LDAIVVEALLNQIGIPQRVQVVIEGLRTRETKSAQEIFTCSGLLALPHDASAFIGR
jgi:hypothetical protein